MIEAMACGTPVIAYESGSVPEVMEDGITGFVVRELDEAAEAIDWVLYSRSGTLQRSF
jgi:glycosyltransferase involved in cell wall biosynthesis